MISGPTLPTTLSGLRELLTQRVELIEHGLRVLSQDLVLGRAASVDVLACDASGVPVLQFLAMPETATGLPARVLAAHAWWRKNAACLAGELADATMRVEAPPRLLVIGQDILADTLEELRRLRLDGLTVAQLCSFSIGGRIRLGVTCLLESVDGQPPAGRQGFTVPEGIVDGGQRILVARFLDLLKRVDSGMMATGDRFSRRVLLDGAVVVRLGLSAGQLQVAWPGGHDAEDTDVTELTENNCLAAVDRVLRVVLARANPVDAGAEAPAAREEPVPLATTEAATVPEGGVRTTTDSIPAAAEPTAASVDEDRFSLEPIRRTVARAQLSREEFSALGDVGSHSD